MWNVIVSSKTNSQLGLIPRCLSVLNRVGYCYIGRMRGTGETIKGSIVVNSSRDCRLPLWGYHLLSAHHQLTSTRINSMLSFREGLSDKTLSFEVHRQLPTASTSIPSKQSFCTSNWQEEMPQSNNTKCYFFYQTKDLCYFFYQQKIFKKYSCLLVYRKDLPPAPFCDIRNACI